MAFSTLRLLVPRLRYPSGLHRLVLVTTVALLGDRHYRGVNHLPATRHVAFGGEVLVKAVEQLLNEPGLGKLLAEQPNRRGIRNAVLDAQPQKSRERQPITHLILHLLVRKIVERLQNQHPKHHDRVERLPASATLPHLIRCQHSLSVGTKSIASSGSPFEDSAANRSSASNNPNCPIRLRITPSRMRFAQLA